MPDRRILPPLEGLRFYIAKGAGRSASLVFVDSEAACHETHEQDKDDDGRWRLVDWHTYHVYVEEFGRWDAVAIRCPASLTTERRIALEVNDPPGHARARLASELKAMRE